MTTKTQISGKLEIPHFSKKWLLVLCLFIVFMMFVVSEFGKN